ncbi:uncharacterized protein LOC122062885 [Macadamia integrifolia]|uniref:uncharacterized protein LOC122062885 n=1 Tax=Macadamia integrifolia TaxID=60698 RepID=UPI001C4F2A1A|nr:uncharacterized protein LOC122062885 [Macadamia integrifolia]
MEQLSDLMSLGTICSVALEKKVVMNCQSVQFLGFKHQSNILREKLCSGGDWDSDRRPPPDRKKQRLITDFLWPHTTLEIDCTPAPAVPIVGVSSAGLSSLPKKSYSKVVGGVLPDVDDLPDPIHAENLTKIVIPQDAYEECLLRYRFALVARINFRFISLDEVRKEAVNSWNLKKKVFIKPMGLCYTLFQFEAEKDMTNIWKQSPIKIGRQFIRFQRWKPDFNIHDKTAISKLVWIRFPGLPFEYWHEKILLSMTKAMGRPLDIDKRT